MYPRTNLKGIIFLLVLLVVWEVIGRAEITDPPQFLPPFSEVLATFYALTMSLELPYHALLTVARGLAGMFLAAVLAIPIGLWMGASRTTNEVLTPIVELLRPIPPAAVIPVSILFLGIGDTMKLAVIAFGSVWPILVNTTAGVQNLDKTLVDTGANAAPRSSAISMGDRVQRRIPIYCYGHAHFPSDLINSRRRH